MSTGGRQHEHDFDPISGWCSRCNLREDGKLVGPGGQVYREGRQYSEQELAQIREKASHARA